MDYLETFNELSQAIGAQLFSPGGGGEKGFSSVVVDSRAVSEGALFVALVGAKVDGHLYLEDAFKAGAAGAMVSRLDDESLGLTWLAQKYNRPLVIVEDTLKGLQDAARTYLAKFPGLLKIGVTGSSGKTTTKEIAAAIISQEKKVVVNSGNLNSETGLPLSVFQVRKEHEVGIFEAGMNRREEIAELANVLNPDIALITNIGSAHIGILGSKRAIAEEKKNIFSNFKGNGIALIPSDDEYRQFLSEGLKGKVFYYGLDTFTELEGITSLGLEGTEINWAGETCRFSLPGNFNLKNALAAIAIAREAQVSDGAICRGLESVKPLFGRGEIIQGNTTVIRDCYNSNPESLEAAVEFCDSIDWAGRRVYVVGSMLELGEKSEEAHRCMGKVLASSLAEKVFLYGAETETAAAVLASSTFPFFHTARMEDLEEALENYLRPGDLVLLKGSRGCALEQLTDVLAGKAECCTAGGGV